VICAVVVPKGEPLSLDELREHVRDAGVMEVHWPERLELVDEFPVTLTGKIRKVELKERYTRR
jgi:cyclohexanecarboxylate-CoA ligase